MACLNFSRKSRVLRKLQAYATLLWNARSVTEPESLSNVANEKGSAPKRRAPGLFPGWPLAFNDLHARIQLKIKLIAGNADISLGGR